MHFPTDQSDARAADTANGHFGSSEHGGKVQLVLGNAMDRIDQVNDAMPSRSLLHVLALYGLGLI